MLQKPLLATAQLITLPIRQRQLGIFRGDAVPEVFDELKALGSSEFEEWRKFRVHAEKLLFLMRFFKRDGGHEDRTTDP
jgi:hypothetical protein